MFGERLRVMMTAFTQPLPLKRNLLLMKPISTIRLYLFLGTLITSGMPLSLISKSIYTNPITEPSAGADPAVLYFEGKYYTYTTNSRDAVYISEDLVHWEEGPRVLPQHLKGAWAPEVYHHPEDGRFYLYYTYRYKIGVAVADRPDMEFKDLGFIAIPGIDAHPFRDDDGQLYLYFTHTPSFTMYCIPMKFPTEPCGPVTKVFEISQEWERNGHEVNEGPWMMKRNGTYYLFYSGSSGQTVYYSIGYATAPTPLGPFTKFEGNPVIAHTDTIFGPGHGSFTMDRAGQWWHLYHQKTDDSHGWKRFLCLDPLWIDDATGEMGSTPTKGREQWAPDFDSKLVWYPEIHPRGSYFYESESVTIRSRTPNVVIHYTTDGSDPSIDSPLYTGAFEIHSTVTVRARAFKEGMSSSLVAQTSFFRTNWKMPKPTITDFPSGNPPFRVYSSPVESAPPPR